MKAPVTKKEAVERIAELEEIVAGAQAKEELLLNYIDNIIGGEKGMYETDEKGVYEMKHVEDMTDDEYDALQFHDEDVRWIEQRATELRQTDHSRLVDLSIDMAQEELMHRKRIPEDY